MRHIILAILFVTTCFKTNAQKDVGLKSININSIQSQMYFLSSDLMKGRQAASESSAIVAEYLASEFGSMGLKPFDLTAKDVLKKYTQPFSAIRYSDPKCEISIMATEYVTISLKEGVDFFCKRQHFNGTITSPVVNYDPTANHKGLVVLYTGSDVDKAIADTKEQGASAILVYNPSFWLNNINTNAYKYHYNESIYEGTQPREMFSDKYMSLENTPLTPSLIEININEATFNALYNTGARSISINMSNKREKVYLRNVLGIIEGSKPDEFVVIGSHFDHMGMQGGYIYNGADDNASGIVAILQIAKAFVTSKEKPRKTIIFALWDGEEYGLLGSKYFTNTFQYLKDVKGYMNFDMIGRNNNEVNPKHVVYFYSASQPKYEKWMRDNISQYSLELEPRYNAWDNPISGSDNASFAKYNIPIIWYHTDGHPDYHQPTDHADKINWSKMYDIIKSAYLNFHNMAND